MQGCVRGSVLEVSLCGPDVFFSQAQHGGHCGAAQLAGDAGAAAAPTNGRGRHLARARVRPPHLGQPFHRAVWRSLETVRCQSCVPNAFVEGKRSSRSRNPAYLCAGLRSPSGRAKSCCIVSTVGGPWSSLGWRFVQLGAAHRPRPAPAHPRLSGPCAAVWGIHSRWRWRPSTSPPSWRSAHGAPATS